MSAPRDFVSYLQDMLVEARFAQEFVAGVEYEDFINNPEKQRAVIRTTEVVGEAAQNFY